MKVLKQAMVLDSSEKRKRWVVLLARFPLAPGETGIEHPTDEVNPEQAINEAVRRHVEYGHSFRPAVSGRPSYSADGDATGHPSVRDGWLIISVLTGLGVELPGHWAVRLQGYGGARDTCLEQVDEGDL